MHSTDLLEHILADSAKGDLKSEAYLDGVVRRTIAVKVPTLTRYDESDFNEMAPQYGTRVYLGSFEEWGEFPGGVEWKMCVSFQKRASRRRSARHSLEPATRGDLGKREWTKTRRMLPSQVRARAGARGRVLELARRGVSRSRTRDGV